MQKIAEAAEPVAERPGARRGARARRTNPVDDPGHPGAGPLTVREHEVLALMAEGLSNPEIANRLFMSPKTASVHVSHVITKLGVRNRTQAATLAQRTGLIPVTASSPDQDSMAG